MFDAIGHSVLKLRRVRIGSITDERLAPKQWRLLAPAEVNRLMKKRQKNRPPAKTKARGAGHGERRG
jgi:23S rRNA pseudouridine2605 synthase